MISHFKKFNCRNSRGQALPLGLALIAFSVLTGIVLFNSAQGTSEKMRLTNAADAAAYSGLLWQARAMNFQSYTNRAMIANQVAIAQAVTLDSWIDYASTTSQNVNTVLGGLPFVGPVTQGVNTAVQTAEPFVAGFARGLLIASDTVNDMLSIAQDGMHYSTFAATPSVVANVSKANDPRFETGTAFTLSGVARNLHDWESFTEKYTGSDSDAFQQRADLIRQSQDKFTQRRDWEFLPFWFYTTPVTRHKVFRRGTTELIYVEPEETTDTFQPQSTEGRWEWKAKDSLSLQNRIWRPFRGTKRIEVPIGWSSSYANTAGAGGSIEPCIPADDDRPFSQPECPKWLGINRLAEKFADQSSQNLGGGAYGGIRDFRDLAAFPHQSQDPRLELRVEVYVDAASTPRSDTALGISDLFGNPQGYAKNEIAAVAGAELYFRRPELERSASRIEYANTYNPFWDVRLKALSAEDRLLALLTRAPDLFSSSSTPSNVPGMEQIVATSGDTSAAQTGIADTSNGLSGTDLLLPVYQETQSTLVAASQSSGLTSSGVFSLPDSQLAQSVLSQHELPDLNAIAAYFPGESISQFALDTALPEEYSEFVAFAALADSSLPDAAREYALGLAEEHAVEYVKGYFEEEIETLVKDVLFSAVQGQINSLTGGLLDDAMELYDQAEQQVAIIQGDLDAVQGEIEAVSDSIEAEVEAVRDHIANRLDTELADLTESIQTDLADFAEMDELLSIVASEDFSVLAEGSEELIARFESIPELAELGLDFAEELTEPMRQQAEQFLSELTVNATELVDSTPDLQAQLLMDILAEESDLFAIDIDTARQVLNLIEESEDPVDVIAVISGDEAELEDEYVVSE